MADDIQPTEVGKSPVERLSQEDYLYIRALICPYCRAGLPDTFQIDRRLFMHTIPGTDELFECQAMLLRLARGSVQHAVRPPDQTMIEE